LLVCRYSGGDDIVALAVAANGAITRQYRNMTGMTGLNDPVDLTEDPRSGCLYVSELGAKRITLLRPMGTVFSVAAQPIEATTAFAATDETSTAVAMDQAAVAQQSSSNNARLATTSSAPVPKRSRAEERLVGKIDRPCRRYGAVAPDLTGLHRRELKKMLRFIRKAVAAARKAHLPIPNLGGATEMLDSESDGYLSPIRR
jgi:hypothetical protein